MTDDDFKRLENKVDKLTDAVGKLILFEERQAHQGHRIGSVESQCAIYAASILRVDQKLDQWINRGIGVWAAAAVVFSLVQFLKR